jgi:hypothetical protein
LLHACIIGGEWRVLERFFIGGREMNEEMKRLIGVLNGAGYEVFEFTSVGLSQKDFTVHVVNAEYAAQERKARDL